MGGRGEEEGEGKQRRRRDNQREGDVRDMGEVNGNSEEQHDHYDERKKKHWEEKENVKDEELKDVLFSSPFCRRLESVSVLSCPPSLQSISSLHRVPAGPGRVVALHVPRFSPNPPQAGSPVASGLHKSLSPIGSSLWDCRCNEAACPE